MHIYLYRLGAMSIERHTDVHNLYNRPHGLHRRDAAKPSDMHVYADMHQFHLFGLVSMCERRRDENRYIQLTSGMHRR
jgi:hypothetical protein